MKLVQYLDLTAPIKVVSEANRGGKEHWSVKVKRKKNQQTEILAELSNALLGKQVILPCQVTLTRIGPKKMDDDNLARAFKGIRDAIAGKLGVDDGDSKVKWIYGQDPRGKREYSIKVEIISIGGALLIDE